MENILYYFWWKVRISYSYNHNFYLSFFNFFPLFGEELTLSNFHNVNDKSLSQSEKFVLLLTVFFLSFVVMF